MLTLEDYREATVISRDLLEDFADQRTKRAAPCYGYEFGPCSMACLEAYANYTLLNKFSEGAFLLAEADESYWTFQNGIAQKVNLVSCKFFSRVFNSVKTIDIPPDQFETIRSGRMPGIERQPLFFLSTTNKPNYYYLGRIIDFFES